MECENCGGIEVENGRNVDFEDKMLQVIADARSNADIVIMCLHSGGQFNDKVGVYTNHLFDIIANAGVDVIVCNHAHTILPIYKIGNCIIAAALGNFSFAPGEGYWVDGVNADYSALLHLEVVDKAISEVSYTLCKCEKNELGLSVTTLAQPNSVIDKKLRSELTNIV